MIRERSTSGVFGYALLARVIAGRSIMGIVRGGPIVVRVRKGLLASIVHWGVHGKRTSARKVTIRCDKDGVLKVRS